MTEAKQRVITLCDNLMKVSPMQIVIDLVQDDIEDRVYSNDVTPDEIGALCYQTSCLIEVYNPAISDDLKYLEDIHHALNKWLNDAEFANKSLGLDPNA
jgi:hypothetical protein